MNPDELVCPDLMYLTDVLAIAVQLTQAKGEFVSTQQSRLDSSITSTADTVKSIFANESNFQHILETATGNWNVMKVVRELVDLVEDYQWKGFGQTSTGAGQAGRDTSYAQSLKRVFQNSKITANDIPIAVSAIGVYNQEKQKQQMKELIANSDYVGKIKERGVHFLKVIELRSIKAGGYLYKCITRDRDLVHFFKNEKWTNVELGDCILIAGTVVEHKTSQYDHDNKTTRVNRVVLRENHGQPDDKASSQ